MSDEPIRAREKCYPPVWLILNIYIYIYLYLSVQLVVSGWFHIWKCYVNFLNTHTRIPICECHLFIITYLTFLVAAKAAVPRPGRPAGCPRCGCYGEIRREWRQHGRSRRSVAVAAFVQPSYLLCTVPVCELSSHSSFSVQQGAVSYVLHDTRSINRF